MHKVLHPAIPLRDLVLAWNASVGAALAATVFVGVGGLVVGRHDWLDVCFL